MVSTQVLEYVPHVAQALAELHRVLRLGGRTLILDTDWDSVVSNAGDRALMERILAAWNERFADPYLPRTLARRLRDAGFEVRSREVLVLFNPEYDPNTYSVSNGRIMGDFVIGRRGITRSEVEIWTRNLEHAGHDGDYFFPPRTTLMSGTMQISHGGGQGFNPLTSTPTKSQFRAQRAIEVPTL